MASSGLYRRLAIVAGFVTLPANINVALVLVVLGLIAGLSMPRERMVLAAAAVIALPTVGAALGHIPAVGAQLTAICGNLQTGIAGAFASALAMLMYELTMDGVMGLTGAGATGKAAHA